LKNASVASKDEWKLCTRAWSKITAIAVAEQNPEIVFIARSSGNVYKIENAPETDNNYKPVWMSQDLNNGQSYISSIYVDPDNSNHLVVSFSNYGVPSVWETKDALSDRPSWSNCEGDLPDMPVRWCMLHPEKKSTCYLATETGVYYTENLNGDNTHWIEGNKGLGYVRIDMLAYRPADRTLVAATHGRGLFTTQIGTNSPAPAWEERGPTNIGGRTRTLLFDPNDKTHRKVWAGSVSGGLWVTSNIGHIGYYNDLSYSGADIAIQQNPIPHSGTFISFQLSSKSDIRINCISADGRLVDRIYAGTAPDDPTSIFWIPSEYLKPGVYFIALEKDGKNLKVKKVMLY